MSLTPIYIAGSQVGLETDQKPYLLPDQAFQSLKNAYVWRERVKKRECNELVGRLRRVLVGESLGVSGASPWTFNIFTLLAATIPETNPELEPGTVVITIGAIVFTDQGDGTLTSVTVGNSGIINYVTGDVTLTHTAGAGIATTVNLNYFPGLPVTTIAQREIPAINDTQTIFFDTSYAYTFSGTGFQQFGTAVWAGTDSDLFWTANYRGVLPSDRLFFATNFVNNASNPIRYYDTNWNDFKPALDTTNFLIQAKILIPYYGRLLALNTWEGTDYGTLNSLNYFNRCRFSQIGSPVAVDAWRSDQFGKGGFIDAPTNEEIISAAFIQNTLIVFFEYSTWQLRYVGEYGLPFIWERVSSDFGSASPFSTVNFNENVLAVGDRALLAANSVSASRIDERIPDLVFSILNDHDGTKRVQGIRDYQRELVFWCYPDATTLQNDDNTTQYFPNTVLVYNYRNNTFAQFRDNVTAFGTLQFDNAITWDSEEVTWDDEDVTWDDVIQNYQFPFIVAGNQQGFIFQYGYSSVDDQVMTITAIDISGTPVEITSINHNLTTGELIYLTGSLWTGGDPGLNDQIYQVEVIDTDTFSLLQWDSTEEHYIEVEATGGTYIGGGTYNLLPVLFVQTKDFNPFQVQGKQVKLSHVDFLTDVSQSSAMTVQVYMNTSLEFEANLPLGNTQVETSLTSPYYPVGSDIAWHRFFATVAAQYVNLAITYDDDLMNDITTHQQTWVLNAFILYVRQGGKLIF